MGPAQWACPGARAGTGQDLGVSSITLLGAAPSCQPQLQLGALHLLGAGSWKCCPSKEGNSQPSFRGEIPHQPQAAALLFFSPFLFFPFPFGLNSWLGSQLWQMGILSQVSAFPSQARGHGIKGRADAREEGTGRFLAPAAADDAGLQPWGTRVGRGPFSSQTSPGPHPIPAGTGGHGAGAASSEWEHSHWHGARACTGHTRPHGAAERLHLLLLGPLRLRCGGGHTGMGVPAPRSLYPKPYGLSSSALVTVVRGDSRGPGALR